MSDGSLLKKYFSLLIIIAIDAYCLKADCDVLIRDALT